MLKLEPDYKEESQIFIQNVLHQGKGTWAQLEIQQERVGFYS